jgi:phosphate starvation-inducible protein PhoH
LLRSSLRSGFRIPSQKIAWITDFDLSGKKVKKIIITRPAVEAGENLGFLPGDLKEKVDPYLRPLYDALDDMLPMDKLNFFMENRVIEIAPLAFMRGRTLDNAYIILDEAQNATADLARIERALLAAHAALRTQRGALYQE